MTPPGVCFFPHRALRETLRIPRPQKGELKSPIFSPDLEKGRGVLDFPLFVRVRPLKIPRSASLSKPGLRPESEESPGNPVRPEIVPGEGGSCTAHLATQERSIARNVSQLGYELRSQRFGSPEKNVPLEMNQ